MSYSKILTAVLSGNFDDLAAPLSVEEAAALIESAESDPGAPFEQGMLARIRATKKSNPAQFMRLRASLKDKKIKVTELDKLVEKAEKANAAGATGQGHPVTFPEIEPWPDAVDGNALLTSLVAQVRRYVILSEAAAISVSLWIMHAYCFDAFSHSPRLGITSPEKRCGKTTLLNLVQSMVPRPLPASNISPACMFRGVEKFRPTLLIDEADTFLKDNEELRGIINSGHGRNGSVLRLVGDNHEPAAFSTFCPTAIAAIGTLPDTIEDRSIKIVLRRRLPGTETVERFRADKVEGAEELKSKIVRWLDDNGSSLPDADPEMPETLNDRACDNWRGPLAIADLIGGDWPERARAAAIEVSADDPNEQSRGVMLLTDIQRVFAETKLDRLSSTDLAYRLCELQDRPWSTWNRGKQITPARIVQMLREFRVSPTTILLPDGKQPNGYRLSQFDDAFSRYLLPTTIVPLAGASPSSPASPASPAPMSGQVHGEEAGPLPTAVGGKTASDGEDGEDGEEIWGPSSTYWTDNAERIAEMSKGIGRNL